MWIVEEAINSKPTHSAAAQTLTDIHDTATYVHVYSSTCHLAHEYNYIGAAIGLIKAATSLTDSDSLGNNWNFFNSVYTVSCIHRSHLIDSDHAGPHCSFRHCSSVWSNSSC